jgi:predicted  nucleic acid-binding Zn-ribbon protein
MSELTPLEQLANDISSLKHKVGGMQDNARLKSVRDNVEDLQTTVSGMVQRVKELRTKGYVFEKDLETKAADFARQWGALQASVMSQINSQAAALQNSMRSVDQKMTELGGLQNRPNAARPLMKTIENELDLLEDKARSAENTINGMYNSFSGQVSSVSSHLNDVEQMLDQLAEASFQLLPTEGGLMSVKAIWCKDVKEKPDDPEGILFLTDQRLIFEQREEIATKKVFFITTETKKVQEVKWEAPVASVTQIQTSKLGLLKNEDHLDLRFGSGAPIQSVHVHIWQPCEEWLMLINRAKAKEFDKTRAIAIDQAAVDKIKALPSQCPGCGANLDQVVLRGQDAVKCEYCGFVIRL